MQSAGRDSENIAGSEPIRGASAMDPGENQPGLAQKIMGFKINDVTCVERELSLSYKAGLLSFFVLLWYLKGQKNCSIC